ncbi:MAG: conjugal transfer protein TraX [Lachnospiraceae bacterium]|nr:conjugal transfer protein TraX [Lachnospiraceae bacterium]
MDKSKKGIPGSTLKLAAISMMLIDHIGAVVLEPIMNQIQGNGVSTELLQAPSQKMITLSLIDTLFRCIGRLAFPIFIFLLVEGLIYTKNRRKYASRLLLFALISEVPFDLANSGKWFNPGYQSVYLTLFFGFLGIWFAEWVKGKEVKKLLGILSMAVTALFGGFWLTNNVYRVMAVLGIVDRNIWPVIIVMTVIFGIGLIVLLLIVNKKKPVKEMFAMAAGFAAIVVLMWIADIAMTDYSGVGVLAIAMAYYLRSSYMRSMVGACAALTVFNPIEMFAFANLFFMEKYNGQRGLKLKYIFYAFYPVHLFILYVIAYLLGAWPGTFGCFGM